MSQHDMDIATGDANTGTTMRAAINAALQALASTNSGATEPSTMYAFQLWADTVNDLLKIRNAANNAWITIGTLSAAYLGLVSRTGAQTIAGVKTFSNNLITSKGADVASASALTLGTDGNYFDITGTTNITSIGTLGVGTVVHLHFDGILAVIHHATNLVIPAGTNILTKAGDELTFIEYATGVWRMIGSGRPITTKGGDIVSATALPVLGQGYFDVQGTTTITSINAIGTGAIVHLHFDAALTLTHHATDLILPGGANIKTIAGDEATFIEHDTGVWRMIGFVGSQLYIDPISLGTEQASTSGTAIDFTSIPAGTKRITIMLVGVSTDGTEELLIQLGDSGGVETSGYLSAVDNNASTDSSTAGFIITIAGTAAGIYHGTIVLTLEDAASFTWVASYNIVRTDTDDAFSGGGSKSLSAELVMVRVTTTGTPDDFDLGAINIQYE